MFKQITLFSFLAVVSMNVFAAQCPAASDWSHKKGFSWALSGKATSEGWLVSPNSKVDSDYTTVPAQAHLYSELNALGNTECVYYLDGTANENELVIAYSNQAADVFALPQPPYVNVDVASGEYMCDTTAATPQVCQWKWKK